MGAVSTKVRVLATNRMIEKIQTSMSLTSTRSPTLTACGSILKNVNTSKVSYVLVKHPSRENLHLLPLTANLHSTH